MGALVAPLNVTLRMCVAGEFLNILARCEACPVQLQVIEGKAAAVQQPREVLAHRQQQSQEQVQELALEAGGAGEQEAERLWVCACAAGGFSRPPP